jgi:hypothetical protein
MEKAHNEDKSFLGTEQSGRLCFAFLYQQFLPN